MTLMQHAKREMSLAGLYDADTDYGSGTIADSVMELIEVYARQEHSGGSAMMVRELFHDLSQFKPLIPISSSPNEWMDVSEASGRPMWQNIRDASKFSRNGGKTWYDIDHPSWQIRFRWWWARLRYRIFGWTVVK